MSPVPWTVDYGSRLLWAFLHQIWTLLKGVGLKLVGLAFQIAGLLDWLAEGVRYNFIPQVQV